jgi:probable HAF family extracellular repeat protein
MKDLGTLGGSSAQANAINDAGQVVGFSRTAADADSHAFLWTPTGGMEDFNRLIPARSGWDLLGANGISNNGQIVGAGTINGAQHAFLLVPVK